MWWRHEKASAKNFNAVSHNRARPEVLFSNLKHGGRKKVFIYIFLAVVRLVAVFKRTMQRTGIDWASQTFSFAWRDIAVPKIVKKLTQKAPTKKENNKLRKFKVLRHGNTGDKLASQSLPKLWHPRFHLTVLTVDKCGHQTWFIYEQLK